MQTVVVTFIMNQHYSRLEEFPLELFHIIFDYLAPHDLLHAFKNLNKRFTMMLKQQPLYLPNNRMMSFEVYHTYLTKILPDHSSQIIHLHLSEHRAPHAVDWFVNQVPLNELNWHSLKAVTIDDVPRHLLEKLLNNSSLLSNIHSLSLDIGYERYHCSDYDEIADYAIVIPLLNHLQELRSVYLRIGGRIIRNYAAMFIKHCHPMNIHENLQTLLINECSKELLIELFDDGHLPQLRRLTITLSSINFNVISESLRPIPLKQIFAPELRHINIKLFGGLPWILTYFEDLQRHSQLEQLNISGHVTCGISGGLPRVNELQRWLTLSTSKIFTFQLQVHANYDVGYEQIREEVFAEYRQATGDQSSARYGTLNICYPKMSFSYPMMRIDDIDTTDSSDCMADNPVDDNMEEMDIGESEYVNAGLLEKLQAVPRWHRLKKINFEADVPDENGVVVDNILHFLHIAQRSPHLRELHIEADLDYSRVISSNVQLGILLGSQLEILYFAAKEANTSLGDQVRIVDTLFGYSTSPPRLKKLTINVIGHSILWLSTRHLVRWIDKVFKRFPALIYFTLFCQHVKGPYSLSELAPEWYAISSLTQRNWNSSLNYRHKPHSLDIWL